LLERHLLLLEPQLARGHRHRSRRRVRQKLGKLQLYAESPFDQRQHAGYLQRLTAYREKVIVHTDVVPPERLAQYAEQPGLHDVRGRQLGASLLALQSARQSGPIELAALHSRQFEHAHE
jgi:hypothetical protein